MSVIDGLPEPLGTVAASPAGAPGLELNLHGPAHWRAVGLIGLELARRQTAVDRGVLFAFAVLHDSQLVSDYEPDPLHGHRATAASFRPTLTPCAQRWTECGRKEARREA